MTNTSRIPITGTPGEGTDPVNAGVSPCFLPSGTRSLTMRLRAFLAWRVRDTLTPGTWRNDFFQACAAGLWIGMSVRLIVNCVVRICTAIAAGETGAWQ